MSTKTPRSSRRTPISRPPSSVRGGSRPPSSVKGSVRGGTKSRAGSKMAERCSMCGKGDKSLAQLPCKHSYCVTCLNKCPVKAVNEQVTSRRSTKGNMLFTNAFADKKKNIIKKQWDCALSKKQWDCALLDSTVLY